MKLQIVLNLKYFWIQTGWNWSSNIWLNGSFGTIFRTIILAYFPMSQLHRRSYWDVLTIWQKIKVLYLYILKLLLCITFAYFCFWNDKKWYSSNAVHFYCTVSNENESVWSIFETRTLLISRIMKFYVQYTYCIVRFWNLCLSNFR